MKSRFNIELSISLLFITSAKNKAFKRLSQSVYLLGESNSRTLYLKDKYLKWFKIELNIKEQLKLI